MKRNAFFINKYSAKFILKRKSRTGNFKRRININMILNE